MADHSHPPDSSAVPARTSHRPGAGTLALAALAATAAWTAERARRAERELPPTGRLLTVDGVQLHVLERGGGPPVLLLHGALNTHADFVASGLVERLSRHHRVIAIDRPGYGHSRRPRGRRWTPQAQGALLLKALRQLGAERPKIVAHSMGTLVAMSMALQHPEAVRSLVLVSGYYYPSARVDAWLTAPVGWPVLGDVLRYTVANLAGRALLNSEVRGMFAPQPVPDGYVQTLGRELLLRPQQLRANAEDAGSMVPAVQAMQPGYHHLAVPLSLIAGADDIVVDTQSHSMRLHRAVAQSRLHLLPGVGHMAHHADPQCVVDAVELAV